MKESNNSNMKKTSGFPVFFAVLLAFAGLGASVYAFNYYFERNPVPVSFLIETAPEEQEISPEPSFNIEESISAAADALAAGKFDIAEELYKSIQQADPENQTAKSGLIQTYEGLTLLSIRNGEFETALNEIQNLGNLDEARMGALKKALTGTMLKNASSAEEPAAEALFQKVLSIDPENADAYEGLIASALQSGNYTEADRLITEGSKRSGSERLLFFCSKLPAGLSHHLDFKQIATAYDYSDYPVTLFDGSLQLIPETDDIIVAREPMVTEITEFSRTLPDENGDITYILSLHHKAHITVMIVSGSPYLTSGVGILINGDFPYFFDYYTGSLLPFSQDGNMRENVITWLDRDYYFYTDTWGEDQTTDDGVFMLDGDKYVRNVYYDYIQTATIKCPEDYDGLCLAFPGHTGEPEKFDLSDENLIFVRANEYPYLTTKDGSIPSSSAPESSQNTGSSQPSSEPANPSSPVPSSGSVESSSPVPSSGSAESSSPVPSSSSAESSQSQASSEYASSETQTSQEPSSEPQPSQETSSPEPESVPSTSQTSTDSFADDVINLVNLERSNAGLGSVSSTAELNAAAQARASEIIESFSHTRPDGTSCFTILAPYGVSYFTAGENIAAGQSSPESVMDAWMNSEGHRANILNGSFNHIGVGFIKTNGGYRYYWVQLFTD